MSNQLDTAFSFQMANSQSELENDRGAETEAVVSKNEGDLKKNQFFSKFQKKEAMAGKIPENALAEEEKLGGAFYLPVQKDLGETWQAVMDALESMEDCDINLTEQEKFNAYGLQYFHDTFMLARTRLCKVEGEEGNFLEIHRLEGDGFVFADQFKPSLVQKIGDCVKDVETVEPIPSENAMDNSLNYLDLSDEIIAGDMIQHWLSTLKPKGGVKYDQRAIYETMSSLGWNCGEENNFKVLEEYSDYIVSPVLEILRHPETIHVPTAYFGALCIDKFVQADAVPENVKTWNSVFMLVEAMQKFCTVQKESKDKSIAEFQVTQSRQVFDLLVSILTKFAPSCTGDKPNAFAKKVEEVLSALEKELLPESLDSLRNVLNPSEEEEVQAA